MPCPLACARQPLFAPHTHAHIHTHVVLPTNHPCTHPPGAPDVLTGTPSSAATTRAGSRHVYRPPIEEFEITCVRLPPGEVATLPANPGPQLLLVQRGAATADAEAEPLATQRSNGEGSGSGSSTLRPGEAGLHTSLRVQRGSVLFVPAGVRLRLASAAVADAATAGQQEPDELVVWAAAVNGMLFQLHDAVAGADRGSVAAAVAVP